MRKPKRKKSTPEQRQRAVDAAFLVGILFKGLDGLVELLVGLPLLVLRPWQITAITQAATAGELREDPHDLIAHLLLHGAANLSTSSTLIGAVYLIVHGAVKVVVVVALFRGSRKVYPWAIVALSLFLIVQIVQIVLSPSIGVALLTVLDVAILALTWREWRHHRTLADVWRSLTAGSFPRSRERLRRLRDRSPITFSRSDDR